MFDPQGGDKLFLASMRCRLSDRVLSERRESCRKEATVDDVEERMCLSPRTQLRGQQHCINVMRMSAKTTIVFLFRLSSWGPETDPCSDPSDDPVNLIRLFDLGSAKTRLFDRRGCSLYSIRKQSRLGDFNI